MFFYEPKSKVANIISLGVGLILPIITIALFKIDLAPPNDLLNADGLSTTFLNLISFDRYGDALQGMLRVLRVFGGGYEFITYTLIIFSLVSLLIIPKIKLPVIILGLVLIVQLIGYFFIYIITPLPMLLHINQSFDRLLMHLYPSFLLLVFSIVSPLEVNIPPIVPVKKPPGV